MLLRICLCLTHRLNDTSCENDLVINKKFNIRNAYYIYSSVVHLSTLFEIFSWIIRCVAWLLIFLAIFSEIRWAYHQMYFHVPGDCISPRVLLEFTSLVGWVWSFGVLLAMFWAFFLTPWSLHRSTAPTFFLYTIGIHCVGKCQVCYEPKSPFTPFPDLLFYHLGLFSKGCHITHLVSSMQ